MPGNILMVAYYFPPLGGAGVQRTLKFSKYLPEFGWNPQILTVSDDPYYLHDSSLLNEIPDYIKIVRVPNNNIFDQTGSVFLKLSRLIPIIRLFRRGNPLHLDRYVSTRMAHYLAVPDNKKSWAHAVYKKVLKIIQEETVDILYTTSAPFSCHLVGLWLKKNTSLPWIADFRDEWAENPYLKYPTALHSLWNKNLEREVISKADHVLTVSPPLVKHFQRESIMPEKISCITNGYDQEDIDSAQEMHFTRSDRKFRLAYSGSFYGLRTPKNLFLALSNVLKNKAIPAEDIRIFIVGNVNHYCNIDSTYSDVVVTTGYLEHRKALALLMQSDGLILIVPREGGARSYPAKVFEYLAIQKPILALVPPESATAELIQSMGCHIIIQPDDIDEIEQALIKAYWAWKNGEFFTKNDPAAVRSYERRHLTRQFSVLLENITSQNK